MSLHGGYGRLPQTYEEPILWRTALQAAFVVCYLYPRALPPVTHGSALQAPERMRGSGDMDTLQAEECLWFFMM